LFLLGGFFNIPLKAVESNGRRSPSDHDKLADITFRFFDERLDIEHTDGEIGSEQNTSFLSRMLQSGPSSLNQPKKPLMEIEW